MSDPWLKFYTSDWRSDPRLKMCSAGARGVWIEMICLMHEATPYGHLLVHGQTPNEGQLASLTGISAAELQQYLPELERMGVFSRTKEGVIYSRKLVRMEAKSAKARKKGKLGGNPTLLEQREKSEQVNLQDKGQDNTQKPNTRNQSLPEANASGRDAASLPDPKREFWERAKAYLGESGIPKANAGTLIGKLVRDHGFERCRDVIDAAIRTRPAEPIPWITASLTKPENQPAINDNVLRLVAEQMEAEEQRRASR